jgi:hypothetical protein
LRHGRCHVAHESIQVRQFALWLLGLFAAIALTLAAVGIYGIMSYVVRQRTHEIGTRVALGATRKDIVWLIMQQGVGIAALGTALGLAAGLVAAPPPGFFSFLLMSLCFSLSLSYGVRRHYRVVHKIKFFKPTLRLFREFAAYLVVARKGTFVVPALILPLPAATFFSESFPLTKHCCDPLGQGIALLLCHNGHWFILGL